MSTLLFQKVDTNPGVQERSLTALEQEDGMVLVSVCIRDPRGGIIDMRSVRVSKQELLNICEKIK